jgi:hypothetical protein
VFRLACFACMAAAILSASPAQLVAPKLTPLDATQAITYRIEDGAGVPGYRRTDRDLAKLAIAAWARESGGRLRFVEANPNEPPVIRLRWISPDQGLFGEMERTQVLGKPGAVVNVTAQVEGLGARLAAGASRDELLRDTIVYLTCVHELGHAVGLPHTRDFQDIMYFFGYGGDIVEYFMRYRNKLRSQADIGRPSGLSTSDTQAVISLYK